jgi:hypothetical protein
MPPFIALFGCGQPFFAARRRLCYGQDCDSPDPAERDHSGRRFVHAMAGRISTSGVISVGATAGRTSAPALQRFRKWYIGIRASQVGATPRSDDPEYHFDRT